MANWYVVRTKPGWEMRAVWHLHNQGFQTYLPRYRKQVRHARKTRVVLRPLFPGYVFINMDLGRQRWRSVNGTVGVISLVLFGSEPGQLPDDFVESLRGREDGNGAIDMTPPALEVGDHVCIREGAFAEYSAVLNEISDEKRVVLLLEVMGRDVRISTPACNIVKAS